MKLINFVLHENVIPNGDFNLSKPCYVLYQQSYLFNRHCKMFGLIQRQCVTLPVPPNDGIRTLNERRKSLVFKIEMFKNFLFQFRNHVTKTQIVCK